MKFALVISAAPEASLQPAQFAAALLAEGHSLTRVFFLREGVRHGEPSSAAATAWLALPGAGQQFELALCISAAERRQIVPTHEESDRSGQSAKPASERPQQAAARFEVVGLGQLVDALADADRVVDFPG